MAMRVFMQDGTASQSRPISGTDKVLMSADGALTGAPTLNGVPLATAPVGGINLSPTSTPPTGYAATGTIVTRSLPFSNNGGSTPFGARADSACAAVGDNIYIFGGGTGAATTSQTNGFNINTCLVTALTGLPGFGAGADCMAAVAVGNSIYVCGGKSQAGTYFDFLGRYDVLTNTWATLAVMPAVRARHTMVHFGGKLYVFGGQNATPAFVGSTWIYDIGTNLWTGLGTAIPTSRIDARAAVIGGKAYVIGGNTSLTVMAPSALNEVYDFAGNSWTTVAPMLRAVRQSSAIAKGTLIHCVGGAIDNAGVARGIRQSQVYDQVSDSWFYDSPLVAPRYGHSYGLCGDNIGILVGFNETTTRLGSFELGSMPSTPAYVIVKL